MHEVNLALPPDVTPSIPHHYVKHFGAEVVRLLDGSIAAGLTTRWDDQHIQFLSAAGGVEFLRRAIVGFSMSHRTFVGQPLYEFVVWLEDVGFPIVIGAAESQQAIDDLVTALVAAGAPINLQPPPRRWRGTQSSS